MTFPKKYQACTRLNIALGDNTIAYPAKQPLLNRRNALLIRHPNELGAQVGLISIETFSVFPLSELWSFHKPPPEGLLLYVFPRPVGTKENMMRHSSNLYCIIRNAF